MRPGNHVLIHIPRGERVENALLRVEAVARGLGGEEISQRWSGPPFPSSACARRNSKLDHVREGTSESYPWAHTAGHPLFEFSRQKSWARRVCCRRIARSR